MVYTVYTGLKTPDGVHFRQTNAVLCQEGPQHGCYVQSSKSNSS